MFRSTTHGELTETEVISYVRSFLEKNPEAKYSLVIGTDSQEKIESIKGKRIVHLVTAIVVHRKGFGGKYFWRKASIPNIVTLRQKIYAETIASLELATSFVPKLKQSLNGNSPHYDLEIHVDVGNHGDSRDMIKEVVGMVNGNGFVAKTKPDAYGASYVADKHT